MRILIVEDEPLLAMVLEENLVELGHEVVGSAATADQGLAAAAAAEIDLALLDFTLGDMEDSAPVARALRDRGIPFVYLTGHQSLPQREGVPPAPLLTKPFTLAELETMLRGLKLAA